MAHAVFLSYARTASSEHAQRLAARLGDLAFLDTEAIDDGDQFPPHLLNGLLDARVVVIFGTDTYYQRRFCRLEMRLALAAGDRNLSHIIVAVGEGSATVLDAMPPSVAQRSWPPAEASERLEAIVREQLDRNALALRQTVGEVEAQQLASAFLEESSMPEPRSLDGLVWSLPVNSLNCCD
jgi:hypothetical protein